MSTHSYQSPLLGRPGAVPAGAEDPQASAVDSAGVAWHYGEPLSEQRQLERGAIVVDRSHRGVLRVSGPDAKLFLHNLLSQKLDDATPGTLTAALDLDVQGRVQHQMRIHVTDDAFYLNLPSTQTDTMREFLQRMIFWSQVEVTETDLGVLTVLGPTPPLPDHGVVASGEVEWQGPRRVDLLSPRDQLQAVVSHLEAGGARLAGLMAYTAERVKALEPEPVDLDHKSIPHEVPHWIGRPELRRVGAVHLEKGCYRGQETVARVENIGRAPRSLVLLHLDGSAPELPVPGQDITADTGGRALGRIGTVVHDEAYGPIALALVKRSALKAAGLAVGSTAVSIDPDSVREEEGAKAGRQAIARLKGGMNP